MVLDIYIFSKDGKSESLFKQSKYSDDKIVNKFEDLGYKNIYHFLKTIQIWEKNYIDENIKLINEYKFHNAEGVIMHLLTWAYK